MELKQALSILNLKEDFTEEELRKSYRTLMMKYHPDRNPGNEVFAETKSKEINEAKTILDNYLKNRNQSHSRQPNHSQSYHNYSYNNKYSNNNTKTYNTYYYQASNPELEKLKLQYEKELLLEKMYITSIDSKDKLFMKHKDFLLVQIAQTRLTLMKTYNIHAAKFFYTQHKTYYQQMLTEYKLEFIDKSNIFLDLNKTQLTLEEVREELKSSINNHLENELNQYINYNCYNDLKLLFEKIKNECMLNCLYGYKDIYQTKISFHKRISEEIEDYLKRIKLLEELKCDEENIGLDFIFTLENSILYKETFYEYYNKISLGTKLKCKIKKHIIQKNNKR